MYTQAQIAALRQFLIDNVATYGALDDQAAAELLNTPSVTKIKPSISGSDVFSATNAGEFDALTATLRSEWLSLCSIDSINPGNGLPAAQAAIRIFGAGSATLAALQVLRSELVSPAANIGLPRARADYVRLART